MCQGGHKASRAVPRVEGEWLKGLLDTDYCRWLTMRVGMPVERRQGGMKVTGKATEHYNMGGAGVETGGRSDLYWI